MQLTDHGRTLVLERLNVLTAEHRRRTERLRKEYEAERARLELMLETGVVAQRIPVSP